MTTFTILVTLLAAALGLCALGLALGGIDASQERYHPKHPRRAPPQERPRMF